MATQPSEKSEKIGIQIPKCMVEMPSQVTVTDIKGPAPPQNQQEMMMNFEQLYMKNNHQRTYQSDGSIVHQQNIMN